MAAIGHTSRTYDAREGSAPPATSADGPTTGKTYDRTYDLRARLLGVGTVVTATLFVAFTAFRLAYAGSKGAALDAGLPEADAAWYPLCIEGVLVVAAVATVVVRRAFPWVVLLAFSGLSVGANVVHAVDQPGPAGWFVVLVAAVPPAALPLCVHLTIATVRAARTRPRGVAHEPAEVGADEPHCEHPALTLVSTPDEPPADPAGEPGEHPPVSTRKRRPVSQAAGGSRSRKVTASALPCDCGCGGSVSRATRTRHRALARAATEGDP